MSENKGSQLDSQTYSYIHTPYINSIDQGNSVSVVSRRNSKGIASKKLSGLDFSPVFKEQQSLRNIVGRNVPIAAVSKSVEQASSLLSSML